jgi:alanine-glyoxylate transaminase/serine-glyoxylate transaminase/serine-pyruvate transaminase
MLPAGLAILGFSAKAMEARNTATLPRTFFDINDMAKDTRANAYPYTPAVGLLNGLSLATECCSRRGGSNVSLRATTASLQGVHFAAVDGPETRTT